MTPTPSHGPGLLRSRHKGPEHHEGKQALKASQCLCFSLLHERRCMPGLEKPQRRHTYMPLWLGVASVRFETWTFSKANPSDMWTQMAKASPRGNEVTSPSIRARRHESAEGSKKTSFPVARQVCFQAFCKWHIIPNNKPWTGCFQRPLLMPKHRPTGST